VSTVGDDPSVVTSPSDPSADPWATGIVGGGAWKTRVVCLSIPAPLAMSHPADAVDV
jgi:hypothetical protein